MSYKADDDYYDRLSAAQQKIAELEARHAQTERNARMWAERAEAAEIQVIDLQNQMFKERGVFTAERQRRESAETDRRELLMMLAARPDITRLFGFKEREICEAARKRNNGETVTASDSEERGG